MRKIKFRGKRKDNVWLYGSLTVDTNGNHKILFSDREIYISRKPNDIVSIALEDGQSYSYIEMTTQECAEMLIDFSNFINKQKESTN